MALSTLRLAAKPYLLRQQSMVIAKWSAPMALSAHDQMKLFWKKNMELKRPNSPWWIYRPHLPMLTSLTHRTTGIIMGVVLYAASITITWAPGDVPSYVEFLKNLHLSSAIWFPVKATCAFPLVYHYINGVRHLSWDAGYGFELKTQYKTGSVAVSSAILVSCLLASIPYWT